MEPTVSVIMSAYNSAEHLRDAIDSVLAQTFKDYEFIIINDGSTDNTKEILESCDDPRIRVYHQENMGLTCSLNRAIRYSRGKFIARIDCDEMALPLRFQKQVEYLNSNPEIGLVGSYCTNIDEGKKSVCKIITPVTDAQIRKGLPRRNAFVHGTVTKQRGLL